MPSQLYLFDCERKVDIPLPTQSYVDAIVIGRGDSILQCDDSRISRTHGTLKVDGGDTGRNIQISSTHSNPIFIRTGSDGVLNILSKDLTANLTEGDKFSLLPDRYTYELRYGDISGEVPANEVTSTGPTLRVRTMEEVNSAPIPEEVNSGEKRKNGDDSEADCTKKVRTEDAVVTSNQDAGEEDAVPVVSTEEPATTSSEVVAPEAGSEAAATVIKPDPDAGAAAAPSSADDGAEGGSSSRPKFPEDQQPAVVVKKESADSTGAPLRPSCQFGIACYRHTPDHRTEFAHPHESDYRRPAFPPAPNDAPHCPFGAACYRRNPQHFREYQHPDSTFVAPVSVVRIPVGVLVPAAQQQHQLPQQQQPPPRRRNQFARDVLMAAIINGVGADDDTASDFDDDDDPRSLFGSGSDSDEYRPGRGDGAEDDDDDDGSDLESEEDRDEE